MMVGFISRLTISFPFGPSFALPPSYPLTYFSCLRICPSGYYQDQTGVDNVMCKHCPVAKYIVDVAFTGSLHDNMQDCQGCPVGYEFQDAVSECKVCQAGRYQNEQDSSDVVCKACSSGKFNPDNQDDPSKHDSARDCAECAQDYFSNGGAKFCDRCPSGKTTHSMKVTNVTNVTSCRDCEPGKIGPKAGSLCEDCPAGFIQPEKRKSFCIPCFGGTFQNLAGQTECKKCRKGKFQNFNGETSCKECEQGKYQILPANTFCFPCIPGSFNGRSGSTNCTKCAVDYFTSETGQTACTECPQGRGTSSPGGASCGDW